MMFECNKEEKGSPFKDGSKKKVKCNTKIAEPCLDTSKWEYFQCEIATSRGDTKLCHSDFWNKIYELFRVANLDFGQYDQILDFDPRKIH